MIVPVTLFNISAVPRISRTINGNEGLAMVLLIRIEKSTNTAARKAPLERMPRNVLCDSRTCGSGGMNCSRAP